MKMKEADYTRLKAVLDKEVAAHPPGLLGEYLASGMTATRMMWDMLWSSKYNMQHLYSYLNDGHIETALRRVAREGDFA